jgi:hypothetical protein
MLLSYHCRDYLFTAAYHYLLVYRQSEHLSRQSVIVSVLSAACHRTCARSVPLSYLLAAGPPQRQHVSGTCLLKVVIMESSIYTNATARILVSASVRGQVSALQVVDPSQLTYRNYESLCVMSLRSSVTY